MAETTLGRRMREWMKKKRGHLHGEAIALQQRPPPTGALFARLPRELRDEIYEYLALGLHRRCPRYAIDRKGVVYRRGSPVPSLLGGDTGNFLWTNRQYRGEFLRVLRRARIQHHHVEIRVEIGRNLGMPHYTPIQNLSGLVAGGSRRTTVWITLRSGNELSLVKRVFGDNLTMPLGRLIDAYGRHNPGFWRQRLAVFVVFDEAVFTKISWLNRFLSDTYWNAITWTTRRRLRRYASVVDYLHATASSRSGMKWISSKYDRWLRATSPNGTEMLPPAPTHITVFAQDPNESRTVIHAQFPFSHIDGEIRAMRTAFWRRRQERQRWMNRLRAVQTYFASAYALVKNLLVAMWSMIKRILAALWSILRCRQSRAQENGDQNIASYLEKTQRIITSHHHTHRTHPADQTSTKMMLKSDPALSKSDDHEAVHSKNGSTYTTENGRKMFVAPGEKQMNENERMTERKDVKDEKYQPQVENREAREGNERVGRREMVD
ncbi:hypothetical protein PRZ48_008857 [Zasmidium cellare]|uniref:Uncharacterized protein n=1 Tax=Zasmidium cellare TaxID=395010 RepID=A0ABR0EHR3_ZASCE|nr:hypothetical protein PRZ48_008857 [Zasmidium cellare]